MCVCVVGGGGEGGKCYFLVNPGRRGSFVGTRLLIAAAFVMTFFFPFSLVACGGVRS